MSSNFIKGGYVVVDKSDKITIDNNELIRKRLEMLRSMQIIETPGDTQENADGFVEGLDPLNVSALVEDADAADLLTQDSADISGQPAKIIGGSQSQLLEDARREAEDIIQKAMAEAEAIKENAINEGKAEGFEQGYNEGRASAENEINQEVERLNNELNQRMLQLEEEYKNNLDEMEPGLINKLTEIYEQVIGISLEDSKTTVIYLLKKAMASMDGNRSYTIHVSEEDAAIVKAGIEGLSKASGVSADQIEVIEDHTLEKNGCMIETEGGIFDVGLDTQLKLLSKQLRMISVKID